MKARLAGLGVDPMSMTSAEFRKSIAAETEKWAKVIRAANIKVECRTGLLSYEHGEHKR
jgi:tripartite-type tricarboxylate transporter receptor subunit TctC